MNYLKVICVEGVRWSNLSNKNFINENIRDFGVPQVTVLGSLIFNIYKNVMVVIFFEENYWYPSII